MRPPRNRRSRRRCIVPGRVVHVGSRTVRGQYLFSPGDKPREFFKRCTGLMAVAAKRYGVEVIAVVLMSNHIHLLLRAQRARSISLFMQLVKAGMTALVHEAHGIEGKVWAGPFSSTNLEDTEAEQHWLGYICRHTLKEDLLDDPARWPGLHCVDALRTGQPLPGLVLDRKAWKAARRRDKHARKADHLNPIELPLARLTDWTGDPSRYKTWCGTLIDDAIAEAAGIPKAGLDAILARAHTYVPKGMKRSYARCFDARGEGAKEILAEARMNRRAAHDAANQAHEHLIDVGCERAKPYLPPSMQWGSVFARLLGDPIRAAAPGPTQIHPDDRPAQSTAPEVDA